jgi:hypothetical protein
MCGNVAPSNSASARARSLGAAHTLQEKKRTGSASVFIANAEK